MDGDGALTVAMAAPKYVRISALALALLAIGGTSLWFSRSQPADASPSGDRPAPEQAEPVHVEAVPEPTLSAKSQETAEAEHHDHDEPKPGDPSHPITPEHLRVYRENRFIHTIDNAILIKDYAAIRRMNAEYKKEFPADGERVQEAYDIIADCLEEKTPERVARARAFWEKRRSSIARRDIRRICLE